MHWVSCVDKKKQKQNELYPLHCIQCAWVNSVYKIVFSSNNDVFPNGIQIDIAIVSAFIIR